MPVLVVGRDREAVLRDSFDSVLGFEIRRVDDGRVVGAVGCRAHDGLRLWGAIRTCFMGVGARREWLGQGGGIAG